MTATEDRKEKITAANKEIALAKSSAENSLKTLPLMRELHKIVTTENIGHPGLQEIPGSTSVLSLNRTNAQVKRLNDAIVASLAQPGQSQLWNTIIETQMRGAQVPGLFTEPQLNKIHSSVLLSATEQAQKFPSFLEKWQKTHDGTLTGATEAWIDYASHNPYYTYKKDARGNVTVTKEKHVIEPQTWQYLRENKMVRSIGDQTFIKQKDGSWVEK